MSKPTNVTNASMSAESASSRNAASTNHSATGPGHLPDRLVHAERDPAVERHDVRRRPSREASQAHVEDRAEGEEARERRRMPTPTTEWTRLERDAPRGPCVAVAACVCAAAAPCTHGGFARVGPLGGGRARVLPCVRCDTR